jgi:hypothetical protein
MLAPMRKFLIEDLGTRLGNFVKVPSNYWNIGLYGNPEYIVFACLISL